MNSERTQVGWRFWLWWVLATTVGYAVDHALFGNVVGAVAGVSVGIAQWLVLRRQVSRAGWWVLASIVGFAIGIAMINAVFQAVSFAMTLAVVGAPLGIAQWFALRRQVSRAGWWVLASTVGFAVGFAVIYVVFQAIVLTEAFTVSWTVGVTVAGVVGGAVYGAITGGVMVWLLRQPITEEPSLPQEPA